MKKGIDVSQWQGDIDFNKVRNDGIEFVLLREGWDSNGIDQFFLANVEKCKTAALPIKGVYHFSYALNVDEAAAEARFCIDNLLQAGLPDVIVFFDFEYDTVRYANDNGITLGPSECNAHAKAFCDVIESRGYNAGIYFNLDYYTYWYDHALLSRYKNWLADYSGDADVPCLFHQYTAEGSVDGISGNVDLDYYTGEDAVVPHESNDVNMDFTKMTDEQVDILLARINARLADLPASDFAKESSEKAIKSGLFSDGDKDGLVDNPQSFARRQEIATLLNRAGILDQIMAIKK